MVELLAEGIGQSVPLVASGWSETQPRIVFKTYPMSESSVGLAQPCSFGRVTQSLSASVTSWGLVNIDETLQEPW